MSLNFPIPRSKVLLAPIQHQLGPGHWQKLSLVRFCAYHSVLKCQQKERVIFGAWTSRKWSDADVRNSKPPCPCRFFTSFSDVTFQNSGGTSKGPGEGNNSGNNSDEDKTSSNKSEEDVHHDYDPKKDSFFTQDIAYGSPQNKGLGEPNRPVFIPEEEKTSDDDDDLSTPTNCCGTGCPNCVWIEYVEKLSKKFTDPSMGREKILKELEQIDDDNIKAYIMMELRIKKLI